METKRVIIVGGDGFCGWPLSLRLSILGAQVMIIDNLSRRRIDNELGSNSLTPISTIYERISTWKELTGKIIDFELLNVAEEFDRLVNVVKAYKPTTIIHLGEQRSAPYSMKSSVTRRYTVDNNINGTNNILNAILDSDKNIHLVHLGTAGVYQAYHTTTDSIIPEGYVNVDINGTDYEILFPSKPVSVYHMTKVEDATMFQFYARMYGLRITDLHQGIVYGCSTKETNMHKSLANRVDFDEVYGTINNRFVIQAALGIPLTIYGTGGQTRGFIHINNSVECMTLAILNPPNSGDKVKIFNQIVESFSVSEIAELVVKTFPGTTVQYLPNPRVEASENKFNASKDSFMKLGLQPIFMDSTQLQEVYDLTIANKELIKTKLILPQTKWLS